jgi:GNAT superfamily N-acetyltransferase
MRPGYAIRPAVPSDLPALREIERAAAAPFAPYGLAEVFANALTPEEDLREGLHAGLLWTAVDAAGAPIGFALGCIVEGNAHLDELDVHPDHARRGIGTALVTTFLEHARRAGFRAATLTTLRHVPWNAPFYEGLGFRVLDAGSLTPGLAALLRAEIFRGLPAHARVAMMRTLA